MIDTISSTVIPRARSPRIRMSGSASEIGEETEQTFPLGNEKVPHLDRRKMFHVGV